MVFHWSLSDSKSPQVSRTLLSILGVLNYAVVWMVSTLPPISKSSSPFSNPLVTLPNAPITIGIIVTCMFHSFFNSQARSKYLSFFSHPFSFTRWSAGTYYYYYYYYSSFVYRKKMNQRAVDYSSNSDNTINVRVNKKVTTKKCRKGKCSDKQLYLGQTTNIGYYKWDSVDMATR